jgi:hypothetical protein
MASSHSVLILNYEYWGQSVGFLGWGISPVLYPLPTQDNTNTEEMQTDIYASSGVRTHDSFLRPSGRSYHILYYYFRKKITTLLVV